jgi:hypothetical protein
MYCRKCYAKLDPATQDYCCPQCGRGFAPADPKTWLVRPFPGKWKLVFQILATTIIGLLAAGVVALFQMSSGAMASGH